MVKYIKGPIDKMAKDFNMIQSMTRNMI
jgi:hypothetical protein